MSQVAAWLADIGLASEELGYGIVKLEPGRITLEPLRGNRMATVEIVTVFLSGEVLREVLVKIPEPAA